FPISPLKSQASTSRRGHRVGGGAAQQTGSTEGQKGATTSPCVAIRRRSACRHASLEVGWPRRAIKGDRLGKARRLLADGARKGHCSTRKRDHPDHGGSRSVRCRRILFSMITLILILLTPLAAQLRLGLWPHRRGRRRFDRRPYALAVGPI